MVSKEAISAVFTSNVEVEFKALTRDIGAPVVLLLIQGAGN